MSAAQLMVSELMHQPVVTVEPGASVAEVEAIATSKGIHHVPITQRGRLLGIVCTCDLRGANPRARALHYARRNVLTAKPDASAADAAKLMIDNLVGSILISNRDGLWGIVTRSDLARADVELAELLVEACCAACQTTHHLRQGPGDTLLCVACTERANATHWFDEGSGD